MLNPIFTDPDNALLKARLAQVATSLKTLSYPTAEEYQAAVYSAVNAVLALGFKMTPISYPISEGPAITGDVSLNLSQVSQDLNNTVDELARVEALISSLYNEVVASQNEMRQSIRETVYASTTEQYVEEFIDSTQVAANTGTIDANSSVCTAQVINQTQLVFNPRVGPNSIGTLSADSTIANLIDNNSSAFITFNGSTIELLFTSASTNVLNRIRIYQDTYAPLQITTLTTSPDGSQVDDILNELGVSSILLNPLSGKFTGDIIIDFPPRLASSVRIIIEDSTGSGVINLRGFEFWSQSYSDSAQVTSAIIQKPVGLCTFAASQNVFNPFVALTHQISYDGTQFISINPGQLTINQPFYYRALFTRNSSQFQPAAVSTVSLDPNISANYTLASSTATPIGTGITQRYLTFTNVTGPITLAETPIPNTLLIQQGALSLVVGTDYAFNNNVITLNTTGSFSISYQTSSAGVTSLPQLESYYTALLDSVTFTAVA